MFLYTSFLPECCTDGITQDVAFAQAGTFTQHKALEIYSGEDIPSPFLELSSIPWSGCITAGFFSRSWKDTKWNQEADTSAGWGASSTQWG